MLEGNLSVEEYKNNMQMAINYYKEKNEKIEKELTKLQDKLDVFEDKYFWNEQYQRISTPNTIKGIETREFLREKAREEC